MTTRASLPYVDELPIEIGADREKTWAALLRVVEGSFASARGRGPARLLACEDTELSGPRPLAQGSAFPGFHVETAEVPNELALAGRPRFSTYLLSFRLEDAGTGRTRLVAETRATFPGPKGGSYRALVLAPRMHALVPRRLLTATKRRAERS